MNQHSTEIHLWEQIPCPLCESERRRLRFQIDLQEQNLAHLWQGGNRLTLSEPAHIVQCCDCTLVYVNPRIRELPHLAHYSPDQEAAYFAGTRALRQHTYTRLVGQLPGWLGRPVGSLLDVGCGDGVLLAAARQAGIRAVGTEISPHLVDGVRRELGSAAIVPADLSRLPTGAYDVVVLLNVLEHARQPLELLTQAARLLTADGLILIYTPNIESPAARLRGRRWHQLEPLEHLVYFSPTTLNRLLVAAGLRPWRRFAIPASRAWKGRLQGLLNRLGIYPESSMGLVGRKVGAG